MKSIFASRTIWIMFAFKTATYFILPVREYFRAVPEAEGVITMALVFGLRLITKEPVSIKKDAGLVILASFLLLVGCASAPQQVLSTNTYYLNDMDLAINGEHCIGVCAPAKADSYDITITSKQDMDQLVISTVGRTVVIPAAIKTNWLAPKRSYHYSFKPNALELSTNSPLAFGGFDQKQGQHSWGVTYFQSDSFKLSGAISCNAAPDYSAPGVAACQEMQGQKMKIWFQELVRVAPSRILKPGQPIAPCSLPESIDGGYSWILNIPARECDFVFESKKAPFARFLLHTIGAESIPVRGI